MKVEDGHGWKGQAAALFVCKDDGALRIGAARELKLGQGIGQLADVACDACNTQVGFKLAQSPIAHQTGKVGLMLPQVILEDQNLEPLGVSLPPPTNELDMLARSFMEKHGILGLSAAWALPGREQPFARSWGWSTLDEWGRATPLTPEIRLRVASVSKSLTAVAVLRLVEAGNLVLDEPALPVIGFGSAELKDARAAAITVRQLLHHVGGGWTNTGKCAMFTHTHFSHAQLIEQVLRENALEYDPGSKYGYSNFGYCLLGRVIEARSGLSYESYVCTEILGRCGIDAGAYVEDGRDLSRNLGYFIHATPGGGRCVTLQDSPLAASLISRMDSHGGWVMNPSELVRFSQALDRPGVLLSQESLKLLTQPTAASEGYAMGWFTSPGRLNTVTTSSSVAPSPSRTHSGGMAGTRSALSRDDGIHCALISNTGGCPQLHVFGWECVGAVVKAAEHSS